MENAHHPAGAAPMDVDPIIEALAACRAARAAYDQAPQDLSDEAFDRIGDFEIKLFSTKPTTRAGALQLLEYTASFLDQDGLVNDNLVGDKIGDTIRSAVAVMAREAWP